MASAGITEEIEELFQSVANDLGWLNLNEAKPGLEEITADISNAKLHPARPRKTKKKLKNGDPKKGPSRRKKKSGDSKEKSFQDGHQKCSEQGKGQDAICAGQKEGTAYSTLHNGLDNQLGDNLTEDCNGDDDSCDVKGKTETDVQTISTINGDPDNQNNDLMNSNKNNQTTCFQGVSEHETKGFSNETDYCVESDGADPILENNSDQTETGSKTCALNVNHKNIPSTENSPSPVLNHSPFSTSDYNQNEQTPCNGDSNEQSSDSEPEQAEPTLSLTERLMKHHRSTNKDLSVRRKERNGASKSGRITKVVDLTNSQSENEENISPTNGPRFKSYRDTRIPAKVSDSSSDDEDKFEDFLASIKSSQTPAKKPPSEEEMDDFVVDDDEPIVISSTDDEDGVNQENEEVFYYQCNNAETPIFPDEAETSNSSSVYKSILSESTTSDNDNFVTPATHLYANYKPIFKKPAINTSKPSPAVSSLLSDSDSEDEFKTPLWEPSTSQKKGLKVTNRWNTKSDAKIPIKAKPLSTMLAGMRSSESEGDDNVFATPMIRPPLKTKKPPNTMPAKPSRPVLNDYHKPQQGHGVRSTPSFLSSLATPYKGVSSPSPYVRDFKKKREELTERLFKMYNKSVFDEKLPSDMSITWNKRLRKTAGYCYYSKSKVGDNRQSRIELSDKVCDTAERLRDTLIHELCHAAAWQINGVHDGHGRYWKYWAAKANIAHPEIPMIKRCHSYEINTKFKYQCTRCSTTIGRHSKSINTDKMCCAYCKGHLILLPTTNKDGTPAKARTPNKFAMFVKENYASAKKDNGQMKHADIMRFLSRDFAGKAKIAE